MKTDEEILNDYYNKNNFGSIGIESDHYIQESFEFRAYICSVRWNELKDELSKCMNSAIEDFKLKFRWYFHKNK